MRDIGRRGGDRREALSTEEYAVRVFREGGIYCSSKLITAVRLMYDLAIKDSVIHRQT